MPEELLDTGNALGWLRAEHDQIRGLLGSCWSSNDPEFTKQALMQLMLELEIHDAVERDVFYPLAKRHISLHLLSGGTQDNRDIDRAAARLKNIHPSESGFKVNLKEFSRLFQHHIYELEQYVFLQLEGGDWEMHQHLTAAAIQMDHIKERILQRRQGPRAGASPAANQQLREAQQMGRSLHVPRDVVPPVGTSGSDQSISTEGDVIDMGSQRIDPGNEDRNAR